jgi:hypothetical protein
MLLTHREGVLSFFTPKGWHFSAQGNALGREAATHPLALKGRDKTRPGGALAPFQG